MGLARITATVMALIAAVAFAPSLGMRYEGQFSEQFGTTGLTNRFLCIAAIGVVISLVVTILVTLIALKRHGLHFLSFFVPKGVPFVMLLLVVPIEVLSYFMRPISHSVRLFANMTAGHTMLKVFGSFVVQMGVFGVLPLALIVALTGLEVAIAVLQAYVFTILTCLYLNDAVHLEH